MGWNSNSNSPFLPARHISLSKEQIDSLELSKSDSSGIFFHFLRTVMYGFFLRSGTRVIAVAKKKKKKKRITH